MIPPRLSVPWEKPPNALLLLICDSDLHSSLGLDTLAVDGLVPENDLVTCSAQGCEGKHTLHQNQESTIGVLCGWRCTRRLCSLVQACARCHSPCTLSRVQNITTSSHAMCRQHSREWLGTGKEEQVQAQCPVHLPLTSSRAS